MCTTRSSHGGSSGDLPTTPAPTTALSEAAVNARLKALGEEELDFDLIKKTIADWSRPLPQKYLAAPLVLVGPSGVGKGRLVKSLMKDYRRFFYKVVTHTTRGPRPDEVNGTSYHFVPNATFHEMVRDGAFMEWAQVHDNFYGTSVEAWRVAQRAGKIPIFEIDVQGAKTMKSIASSYGLRPRYLFVAPPQVEKLRERLVDRGTETPEQIALRIASAEREVAESKNNRALFDLVLVNDDYQLTVNALFRTMRDWYPALPSAARIRMLQRRLNKIKHLPLTLASVGGGGDGGGGAGAHVAAPAEKEGEEEEVDVEEEDEAVEAAGKTDHGP